jgi:hypothetical protein
MVSVTIKSTGEVLEFAADTPSRIVEAWQLINEYIDAYEKAKDELKKLIPDLVDERGVYTQGDVMFRVASIQRMAYDKAKLREVFDEDTLDLFLQPEKGKIDRYIKEHLNELGEMSTLLRKSMVPVGRPYQVIRLEKLSS